MVSLGGQRVTDNLQGLESESTSTAERRALSFTTHGLPGQGL